MYPKIVLAVSKTHWRCLTCKLLNKRGVSIDQHLASIHPQLKPLFSKDPGSNVDTCCHSDGELDTKIPCAEKFFEKSSSVTDIKVQQSQSAVKLQEHLTEQTKRPGSRNQKRKSPRKEVKTFLKLTEADMVEKIQSPEPDSDVDYLLADGDGSEDENKAEEELPSKQRMSKRLKKKVDSSQTKQKVKTSKDRKKSKPTKTKKTTSAKLTKVKLAVPTVEAGKSTRKTNHAQSTSQTQIQADEGNDQSELFAVKDEFQISLSETAVPDESSLKTHKPCVKKDELPGKGNKKQPARPNRKLSLSKASESSPVQVDKTNIATSCLPWLLDLGRKAGDKVTKKTRRALPPEEKQAVRELYGVPLLKSQPQSKTPPLNTPRVRPQPYAMANQSMGLGENFSTHHPNLVATTHQQHREADASAAHQSYVMNILTSGSRDFFADGTRRQESLYPGCSSAYSQQQSHNSHYNPQVSEFYPPAVGVPPQRLSMLMNFQGYSQESTSVLSAPAVGDVSRHELEGEGYLARSFTMNSVPQSQGVSQSVSSIPHTQTKASCNIDTGLVPDSQTPTTQSVSEFHSKEVILDSNQDNQCRVCEEEFQSSGLYQKHQKEVACFDTIECKRCHCKFHGLPEFNLHVFSIHETEKQGFCFMCDQNATGMESLEKHVYYHAYNTDLQRTELRFHDCRVCCEELKNSYAPVCTHYYQNHALHICSHCYETFNNLQAFKDHLIHCHKGMPVFCSICGSKFESMEDLTQHAPCVADIWAEDGKGENCFKCKLWCPNRASVEAHRKQHRSQEDVEAYRQGAKVGFPCSSCEKVFKNKHACRRHIKMVHEGVVCYKHYCEFCGKGFLTKGHMRDHIALHHDKIKRYKCDYCELQFVCGPTLRRHVRVQHTKHKPYQCPHCEERFFEKTPLQRHLTSHTGLSPFMCEHCGKGFYTKHSFRNHSSTHSTVKEFVCTGCQKGFTRKYNLSAHTKICKTL